MANSTNQFRVDLRVIGKKDREAYFELRRISEPFLRQWEGSPSESVDHYSPEFFDRLLSDARKDIQVIERLEDEKILGIINICEIIRGSFQSAFLGYWIGAPYARQGYMTEALKLALKRVFYFHQLHRVEANIMPKNIASIALVRRVGFRHEGCSKRYLKIAGTWEDHERWAMTVEDWEAS